MVPFCFWEESHIFTLGGADYFQRRVILTPLLAQLAFITLLLAWYPKHGQKSLTQRWLQVSLLLVLLKCLAAASYSG